MTYERATGIIYTTDKVERFSMELPNGYVMTTTFMRDFDIADMFGENGIKDTFRRAFKEYKNDIIYMAELYVALNWHIWKHYEHKNNDKAKLYDELWRKVGNYVDEHFKGEDLKTFYHITD